MKIKRKTILFGLIAFILSLAVIFFTVRIRALPDQTGIPLPWLRYEWKDPSYIEFVQYPQLIIDIIFWFIVAYVLLVQLNKLLNKNVKNKH